MVVRRREVVGCENTNSRALTASRLIGYIVQSGL